ncbi:MAG: filamentous hemagglutinin N-terminal domain-containing protein [Sphingomonadales bacterium]|nr:MAG: filamentous hemagglutinin N-terminal domain-containing protein [Sphingomonadales bacterium]
MSQKTPGRPTRTAAAWRSRLLIGVGALALCAPTLAHAQSAAALRSSAAAARGQATVAAQTAALARPGAPVGRGAQSAVALRASTNAARVAAAVSARASANALARQAALQMVSTIPNGLGAGGLQPVANGVRIENIAVDTPGLNLWHGANAPTQSVANGQTTVTVQQTEQRAVLSWETFNVGRETTLVFDQKQNGVAQQDWIALNRVVGQLNPATGLRDPSRGADPSRIAGQIKADGTVIVINQNGVIFTPTAKVNTHAAIATSLEITAPPTTDSGRVIADQLRAGSEAFLRDGLLRNQADLTSAPAIAQLSAQFTAPLNSQGRATIENRFEGAVEVQAGAELETGDGGFLILAAPAVSNAGVLKATNGSVSLVAGREVVLRAATGASDSADPNIRGIVAYSPISSRQILREVDGEPLSSINGAFTATNTGLVQSTRGYLSIVAGVNSYQTLVRDDEGRPVLVNGTPRTEDETSLGRLVNSGVLYATTSVARNGFIDLVADRITLSAVPVNGGAPDSSLGIVAVAPDDNGETVPNSPDVVADFRVSRVSLTARLNFLSDANNSDQRQVSTSGEFELLADSLIYAPGGDVVIGGGDPRRSLSDAQFAERIFIDTGAAIDVSGIRDLVVPASRNSVRIRPVTRNELRDTPDYREGFLRGATVLVDPRLSGVRADGVAWIGSPLIEAGSFTQQVGVTSAELLTRGGTISLGLAVNATPGGAPTSQLIVKPGASLDVSGGFVRYEAGLVQTSRLVTASGQIVDIGVADPNETYVSLLEPSVERQDRFGIQQRFTNPLATGSRFVEEFIEGRDAGAILIQAQSAALDGGFYGSVVVGARQIADSNPGTATSDIRSDVRRLQAAASQLPAGGLFSYEAAGRATLEGANFATAPGFFGIGGGDIRISPSYTRLDAQATTLPSARLGDLQLDDDLFAGGGFAQANLVTSGAIIVDAGAAITLQNGGAFTAFAGRSISVAAGSSITAQSGLIDLETFASLRGSSFSTADDVLTDTSFDIRIDGTLSTKGRWVNDFGVIDVLARGGSAYLDGGSISLSVASRVNELPVMGAADPNTSTDRSGSILLNASAVIDVSGGGYIDPDGNFDLTSRGGNLALTNSTVYFGLGGGSGVNIFSGAGVDYRLRAILRPTPTNTRDETGNALNPANITAQVNIASDAEIRGHGFAGGGGFDLTTPALSLLSREDYESLYADGDFTGPGTVLPLDFIEAFGFASYNFTVYKTRIFENQLQTRDGRSAGGFNALLDTEIIRLGAGQTLRLEQARFSPFLTSDQVLRLRGGAPGTEILGVQTGADLYSDAVSAFLQPTLANNSFDQLPVSLTFGGLTELDIEDGAAITGAATSSLTASKIKVSSGSSIRLPGGTIGIDERLPEVFTVDNTLSIGIRNLSDILTPSVDDDGNTVYVEEDRLTQEAIDGLGDNTRGLSTQSRNIDVANSLNPLYFLGDLDSSVGLQIESGGIVDLSGASLRNPRARVNPFTQNLLRTGRIVSGGSLDIQYFTIGESFPDIFNFSDINQNLLVSGGVSGETTSNDGADRLARIAVLEEGAVLDLSGVSDTFDQLDAAGRYVSSRQWSAGGSLTLNAGSLITGADIRARGGDPAARDGTLLIRQAGTAPTTGATLVNLDLDIPSAPAGAISVETITAAGFETLEVQGALRAIGDVDLTLGRGFLLTNLPTNTNVFVAPSISVSGDLVIDAPYVRLQSIQQRAFGGTLTDGATDSLTVNAQAIDLVGSVSLGSTLASVTLNAAGDVRLIGVDGLNPQGTPLNAHLDGDLTTLEGAFVAPGTLRVQAAQVFATTGSTFYLGSTLTDGTVPTVTLTRSAETAPLTPYSAGSRLLVLGANIQQDGVLRAPLGEIVLGSATPVRVFDGLVSNENTPFPVTQQLSVGPGSITSVSANGLLIPYGTTTDQTEYFFAPTSGSDLRTLAESGLDLRASLTLAGNAISVDAGAEVDLSGGGDAYGYEFISGVGGSRDVLNSVNTDVFSSNNYDPDTGIGFQFPDGQQVYAVVPSLRDAPVALQDPILSNPNPGVAGTSYDPLYASSQVGRRVYLEASPGLAAGWYTLLPAQYALLPGGFRVVEQSSTGIAGQSRQLQGGATLVAGRYGLGNSEESQIRVFNVQSQEVFRQSSNIALTSFSSAVESANVRAGRAVPQLPRDAARLTINPVNTLQIDAAFLAQAAQGGRGSQVDITGTSISISDTGTGGGDAVVALSSRALTNLNAGSLLIGGTRSQNSDGSTSLDISADQITLQNSASAPLVAGEVLLAVDGAGSAIVLADGAAISTDLRVSVADTSPYIIDGAADGLTGKGALVRVANGPERTVQRLNVEDTASPASLTAGLATLSGTSVALLSTGTSSLDPLLDISAENLSIGAGTIELIASADQAPTPGRLSLTPELLQSFARAESLTLNSLNAITIFSGAYSFGTLTLDTPSLALAGTGDVALNVADLSLQNSASSVASPTAAVDGATLSVTTRDLALNDGAFSFAGFEAVNVAATDGVFYLGKGSLGAGSAALAITTPILVDRAVDIAIGEAARPIDYTISTAGALSITGRTGAAAALPDGTPGASLTLRGTSVSIADTDIRATAGRLALDATAGDVTLTGDATLAAPTFTRVFGDEQDPFRVSAPGGLIAVQAQNAITLGAGVTLNIGGGEDGVGRAGALSLEAGGDVNGFFDAAILAAAPEAGAALRLRQANSFDLGAFATSIGSAFTGGVDIETGAGNLDLASGQTLKAHDIRLVANDGAISIAGTLDAAGLGRAAIDAVLAADADNVSGGSIVLFGNAGLTLASSARLDAHTEGYKITDERRAHGGDVTLGIGAQDASLEIDSGAVIDVGARRAGNRLVPQLRQGITFYTFVEADQGGTVNLRAPLVEQAGADSVNVAAAGQILGARSVRLEAVKRFDLQSIADSGAFAGITRNDDTITLDVRTDLDPTTLNGTRTPTGQVNFLGDNGPGTIVDFVQNFDISAATGLSGLDATGVFEAAPGVDLAYDGAITLASNWNLGAAAVNILGASADRGEALVDNWQDPSLGRYFVQRGAEGELLRDYGTFLYRVGGDVRGAAPTINFLAGGDLNIRGSITDGFFNFRDQSDTAYRQVSLGGAPQPGAARVVDAAFTTTFDEDQGLVVAFGTTSVTQINPLAPYSMAANNAAATGNDPLESAEVFPLIDGVAPGSATLRLTAGALGGNDPASTRVTGDADLRIGFDSQYTYTRGAIGATRFSDNVSFVLAANPVVNGIDTVVSASEWRRGVLATYADVSDSTPTRLTFDTQNAALTVLRQAAQGFFTPDELTITGGVVQSVNTTVGRAAAFLQSAGGTFGDALAAPGSGFTATNNRTGATGTQTVAVRAQVRTGTGSISLAAAGDIDLRTLNADGDNVLRDRLTQVIPVTGGSLVGSTPVFTAGARTSDTPTTGIDVLSGVTRDVALVTGQTPAERLFTINQRNSSGLAIIDAELALRDGGDVAIAAGGSLLAQRDDFSRSRTGSETTPWQVSSNLNNSTPARVRISAANTAEAVGTLGGGTVKVRVDGALSDATLVSTGTVSQVAVTGGGAALPATSGLQFGGGGDLDVSVLGDIQRGLFDVGGSEATITTYSNITGVGSPRTVSIGGQQQVADIDFGASVRSATASVDIRVTGSARFAGLGNNSLLYTEASGIRIGANGTIEIVPEGDTLNTNATNLVSTILPGSVDVQSIAGRLSFYDAESALLQDVDRSAFLYPSREGRLRLLAQGTLSAAAIAMSDADIGGFNGPLTGVGTILSGTNTTTPADFPPFAVGTSLAQLAQVHNQIPTHLNNPEPVRIASGGDLIDLSLNLPKQARVSAARDIVNIIYIGQNINRDDVTRIVAGRDLTATVELAPAVTGYSADEIGNLITFSRNQPTLLGNSIVLGGPGSLFVEAGRDAGPFLTSAVAAVRSGSVERDSNNTPRAVTRTNISTIPGGILTVGNEQNPFLGAEGATLTLSFGVAGGADFAGLRDAYVNADAAFLAGLDDSFFGQIEDDFGNRFADREQPIYAPILFRWLQQNQPELLQETFGRTDIIPDAAFIGTYRNADGSTEMRASPAPGQTTVQAAFQSSGDAYRVALERPDVFTDAYRLYGQGVALLRGLPLLVQRQFLQSEVYFNELQQVSRPDSPSFDQSSRGYAAVETLYNPDRGYSDYELQDTAAGRQIVQVRRVNTGNLDLRLATLQTARGGDITILAPGGNIIAGSVVRTSEQAARRNSYGTGLYAGRRIELDGVLTRNDAIRGEAAATVDSIPLGFEGILTLRGGAIRSFTDGSLILNQSRLFTQQGGDIVLWSSGGNLNAGQGPRSAASFPPVQVLVDENAFSELNVAGAISGAGIAGFQPSPDVQAPNVFLIAPLGTVDAGEAGIRVAGNLFVSAQAVANAENISVGGSAVGVPAAAAVDAGANAAASAASAAANAAVTEQANRAGGRGTAQSRITVDVIGFSGDDEDDDPCKRRGTDRPANCPPAT